MNSLLGNLGMKLGIANLMLSDQGTCAFDYKDELEITIELPEASEQIYIYAVVTEIPKKGQKKLFRKLLRLNLFCFETNGATFAIHEEHNCVLLCYQHAVQTLDQNGFETILENFLTTLERLHENVHSEQYVDEHELAADDRIDPTRFIRA
ncbi:MAG: CesT family type III secretion system chaperone [Geminicoccaceae bacterium]